MAEYRLTPAAESDLEGIWVYTCQQWGVEQAQRYTRKLVAAIDTLTNAPSRGLSCDHIRLGYRWRMVEHHVIYYLVT